MANSPLAPLTDNNKNLYNGGSEWQNDYGILPDLQQTYYRNYDAALGRWIAVDPVAESAESMTVYQYAGNNPIMLNDPLGDKAGDVVNGVLQQHSAEGDFQDWLNTVIYSGGGGGAGGNSGYAGFWNAYLSNVRTASPLSFSDFKDQYDAAGGNLAYGIDFQGNVQYAVPYSGGKNLYSLLGYSNPNDP